MTGRDPGELGIYGFRNRTDHGLPLAGGGRLARGAASTGCGITSRARAST